jgi:S-adenosylmethionine hydrolase
MGRIITLTTDFGMADPYVAAMKGVILSIDPEATVVDVSHEVAPQRIAQAVYLTGCAWPHFPPGSIHLVVVDPGVGTERRAIIVEGPRGLYVGPDNGVLSAALPEEARSAARGEGPAAVALPRGYRAFLIAEPRFLRQPVSDTFHGRDVFAPAAGHLSAGVPPGDFGEAVGSLLAMPPIRARRRADGALVGRVVHVDRFGNLVTDVRAEDLPRGRLRVEIAGRTVEGLARTYAEAEGLTCLVGSSGYLEVARPGGSAAASLGVGIDEAVLVRAAG